MRRPLLLFPTPDVTNPARRNGGGGPPNHPSVTRQAEILGPKFSRLEAALDNRRIEIQCDTPGIDPEYTVVIETYGSVADFFKAAKKIEGLEWLGEYELRNIEPDEDFYNTGNNPESGLNGQVMLMLSDRRAINELLSLWRRYGENSEMVFDRGWTKFRDLFRLLKDIRYWDTQDRLRNTGILEYWEERLEDESEASVRFEAELWFRTNQAKRESAYNNVARLVRELGGQVVSSCCFPDIHYQSLLLELPAGQINSIISEGDVALVRCDQVMLFRPLGQMNVEPLWNDNTEINIPEEDEIIYQFANGEFDRQPRVALLDGLPLANHADLRDSLIIDDPDDFESNYPAASRIHGTAMASLIVNGDLQDGGNKLTSPLYVRPIMKPDSQTMGNVECIPDTELPLDIIHRAIRRIFEGDGDETPVAPSIKVINLSIGDPNIHFNGKMSPFARMLDWLSNKYNVLFIVSAGNHPQSITVPMPGREFHSLSDESKATTVFNSLQNDSWGRKLLSPAESVNAITVGATHEDSSIPILRNGLYNIYDAEMPAAYSAHGNGYARAVKPDIVMPGGRMLHNEPIGSSDVSSVLNSAAPGQLVASPHPSALNNRAHLRGTSNSAALTSRACAEICDILEDLFTENNQISQYEQYSPLMLKSLIAHGASWGSMQDRISNHLGEAELKTLKNVIARNIGYGKPDIDRVKYCLDTRATILGYGELQNNEAHIYKLPIPEGLGGVAIWRRLTVSLSWFAKPCPTHMKYRDSALWFTVEGDNKEIAKQRTAVDWMQVKRGTLQHEIFEGDNIAVITEDRLLEIKVNCKENASTIDEPVKYSVAITLEVAEGTDIQLYHEIQEVIEAQIQEQVSAQVRAQVAT